MKPLGVVFTDNPLESSSRFIKKFGTNRNVFALPVGGSYTYETIMEPLFDEHDKEIIPLSFDILAFTYKAMFIKADMCKPVLDDSEQLRIINAVSVTLVTLI